MVSAKVRQTLSMEERKRYWLQRKVKKLLRKYAGYLILFGIIFVSFLIGLIVGACSFSSEAISPPEETLAFTDRELVSLIEKETTVPAETSKMIEVTEPQKEYFDVPLSNELQDYIDEVSLKYSVPCELVYAMIEVESNFRPNIVSSTDDYGLMQINKINHEWLSEALGITDFLDPKQNILSGVYMISQHLEATDGDMVLALMRYNNGATGAKRLWNKGIYSTSYTDKVMAAYENYKK